MDKKLIYLAITAIVLLSAALIFLPGSSSAPEGCENYYTKANITALSEEGKRLLVVENAVYDISNWTNSSYDSGMFLLSDDLTEDEKAALGSPEGFLCTKVLENLSYSERIGFSPGSRTFTYDVLNKTVQELKERTKRLYNSGENYAGWYLKTNMTLIQVDDLCSDDFSIAIIDYEPQPDYLESCGRQAFYTGEGDRIYIVKNKEDDNEFITVFTLTLMEQPGCGLISRCE